MNLKVLVTGANGFLGRHAMPALAAHYGAGQVRGVTRAEYDLEKAGEFRRMIEELRPETVVHLAGYVGGIGANQARPADFYFRNTLLTAYAFQAAAEYGLRKLVYTMGGCSYPAQAASPIGEDQIWNGYAQKESAAYSMAKKMGLVASEAYRAQYGLDSVVLIPGNLYGEYDNFRKNESHVVPALLRRCYEAVRAGAGEVRVWGSGRPVRDFVYAGDVAALLPYFIDHYDGGGPVNLSSGAATSIMQLAELAAAIAGFRGKLVWDTSKPDGQMVKVFDVSRMKALGLDCATTLEAGLERTFQWLAANYDARTDGIRR